MSVLEANRDYDKWAEVARRSRITLASAALRPPAGARGLELEVRVEVRDELPSGADPGLEVDLLGIPLKHGKGDRSARLSLLEPKVEVVEVEVPSLSGQTVKLPQLAIGVVPFGLAGDPADMGAKAQRRVHLTVTRRSVL